MHVLHVGYVGIMGNLHYLEILDFVLGWPGWDISGDDKATWLAEQKAAEESAPPPGRANPPIDVGPLDAQP